MTNNNFTDLFETLDKSITPDNKNKPTQTKPKSNELVLPCLNLAQLTVEGRK